MNIFMNDSHSHAKVNVIFMRLFFKFATVIKIESHISKKIKSVILSFCQGL